MLNQLDQTHSATGFPGSKTISLIPELSLQTNPSINKEDVDQPFKTKNKKIAFSRESLGVFECLIPNKNKVVNHAVFSLMGSGDLPIPAFKKTLLNFYPLVENFPKFMALNLAKTRSGVSGHEEAKSWLISNIKVEKNHAKWYRHWAYSFGISQDEIINVKPTVAMEAVVNYLWSVGYSGSLASNFAATNIGIEWATGEWSARVITGVKSYVEKNMITPTKHLMTWLDLHANYDDTHPFEAMDLVMKCADSKTEIDQAVEAANRALEFYILALDDCLR